MKKGANLYFKALQIRGVCNLHQVLLQVKLIYQNIYV
jgi:hypothetical protein